MAHAAPAGGPPAVRARPGLAQELALTLALLTVSTIVLNAGVFWLLLKKSEEQQRTDFAGSLAAVVASQVAVALAREEDGEAAARRVVGAYNRAALDLESLVVVGPDLRVIAGADPELPATPDVGLREALYGGDAHVEIDGALWGRRWVVVTSPVGLRGRPRGALRVRVPLRSPLLPGGPAGFVLAYTGFSGLLIGVFGFQLLRRRLLRPVAEVKAATEHIAAGGFGATVEIDAAPELEDLARALSSMSAALADYRLRTALQVEHLEAANRELQEAQAALVRSERLAGVGRLAAGLAHEVGNPLAAVLGMVELLQQGLGDSALEQDLLRRARRELERIHIILRALLDHARAGPGRPAAVDLGAAAREAAGTVGHRPERRGAAIEVRGDGAPCLVWMEPDKLHQVLVNLLVNAVDAAGAGGVWLEVEQAPDGAGVLTCCDEGPGFSADALERALEPFFTTKEPGRGTGLGLATCAQLVQAAGGSIELANAPEGGARVRIRVPAPQVRP